MIDFFYGAGTTYINITQAVFDRCSYGDHVFIPAGENVRTLLFSDPVCGVDKSILMVRGTVEERSCTGFNNQTIVDVRLTADEEGAKSQSRNGVPRLELSVDDKIRQVHEQIHFTGGSLGQEWTEQRLTASYLDRNARVLEIGSDVGRNSLLISSILEDDRNFVALECNPAAADILRSNRDSNNRRFNIESSAVSYRMLVQRGWDTVPSAQVSDGYRAVEIIGYEELEGKYGITFDTWVLDCGGAIYYLLRDNPRVLANVSTIISQSDYRSTEHKIWVDQLLYANGFQKVYAEPLFGPEWLPEPDECQKSYYEVWKK